MTKPSRWSYTAWSTAKGCLRRYYEIYFNGNRQPDGPASMRGIRIHHLAEYYLKGKITGGVPKQLAKLSQEFQVLKQHDPVVEKYWGVNSKWMYHHGKDSWCVMKMDAAVTPTYKDPHLTIIDFKTGQEYEGHSDQGELYLSIGFAIFPFLETADTEFWYTDLGYPIRREYKRKQIVELTEVWHERGRQLMSLKKFPASPSHEACRWCHIRSDRGGRCKAWLSLYE
jgi:hypothetical protein